MKKEQQQQFDDFFKNRLEQNVPTPPSDHWKKIASDLDDEALDVFFHNQLNDIQPTPPTKVWNNIKRKLPLSLLLRNQLNWLSRIAAVLIVFMVVLLVWNKDDKIAEVPTDEKIADVVQITEVIEPTPPVDFVFAINDDNDQNLTSASEELSLEDDKTHEDFWSSVIDDEDDFLTEVDEEVIDKSLEPYFEIPSENTIAELPKIW